MHTILKTRTPADHFGILRLIDSFDLRLFGIPELIDSFDLRLVSWERVTYVAQAARMRSPVGPGITLTPIGGTCYGWRFLEPGTSVS